MILFPFGEDVGEVLGEGDVFVVVFDDGDAGGKRSNGGLCNDDNVDEDTPALRDTLLCFL